MSTTIINDGLSRVLKLYYRLKTLNRFNSRPRIISESVAEHSFYVILISYMLIQRIKKSDNKMFEILNITDVELTALTMALIHDLPESIISDIPYDSKKLLNVDEQIFEAEIHFFSSQNLRELFEELHTNHSLPARIVHAADIISVLLYSSNEISLGNSTFISIYDDSVKRLEEYSDILKLANISNYTDCKDYYL